MIPSLTYTLSSKAGPESSPSRKIKNRPDAIALKKLDMAEGKVVKIATTTTMRR
jgi:hypothetical protein